MALDASEKTGVKEGQDEVSGLRVQRSKSLVPPSIVELSSNRVVLSWRTTTGQRSIRTEVRESGTDSEEWANLEEENSRHRGVKPTARASTVDVFEVDHVELQTCRGCPQCLHGGEYGEEVEEEATEHRYGRGCWRPIYQGTDCRCEIDLGQDNSLHYFRLLVRARLPSSSQRGYMRPKHVSSMGFEAGKGRAPEEFSGDRGGGRLEDESSSKQTSPHRRRRRRRRKQQPGVGIASLSDSDEATHLAGMGGDPREDSSDVNPSRGAAGVTQGGDATIAGERVQWFASDSVFVESRPPPVTLHGIGTALVLTWPGVVGYSGAEKVSYILEQWWHAATFTIFPPSKAIEHRPAVAAAAEEEKAADGVTENKPDQTNPASDHTSRQRQRRRHHYHHATPPKHVEAKEVFSVGTRCWFMPTHLRTGKRYWYRLRLIHEGGKGVGGPWVSHLTCLAPPRCVEVGSRSLVLSLPRAIDEVVSPAVRNNDSKGGATGGHTSPKSSSDDEQRQTEYNSAREDNGGSGHSDGMGSEAGQGEGGGGREEEECEEESEAPMVWYTLEGLTGMSGWSVLYRGPAPKVVVEGLEPNTLVKFRVGIDVDVTELRRRSLRLLDSLELEASSPSGVPPTADTPRRPIGDEASTSAASTSGLSSPKRTPLSERFLSPQRSAVVRPALRLYSAGARCTGSTTVDPLRRSWSPVRSPAMSMMKREGFAVHDVGATIGGGFYLERPMLSWGRLQGHCGGAVWESGTNRAGDVGDRQQCREYSAIGEFSTASMPPRFASFVVGGVPQVKLWWALPRPDTDFTTSPAQTRPATAPPSPSPHKTLSEHRQNRHHGPTKDSTPSLTQDRPSTAAEVMGRRLVMGREASTEALPPERQKTCACFKLDILQPEADGGQTAERSIYSGPELWANLVRIPASASRVSALPPIAPSTAYCVKLSTKTSIAQPDTAVEAVVVTAPPAPFLEPEPATPAEKEASPDEVVAGEGSGLVGAVTLKAAWNVGIDTSFLPAGVEPPPVSFALEMAHASEAGPRTHGPGGTATKVPRNSASCQDSPPAFPFASARSAAATDSPSPANAARPLSSAQEVPVRKDAGYGQCWTLCSSSWGRPKTRAEGFRVVWTGEEARAEEGRIEARTPPLPPGMRFAFRVRAECRFGVAVSAATVYQTAVVAPLPPKGLRAILATHESRAGKTSRCVRLLWDSFHNGHGRNVVTSFAVQVRRPRYPPRAQVLHDRTAHPRPPPILGHAWKTLCSCMEIGCLDPITLGVAHIVAEYRVRAEGPGGKGPWSEPLPVDIVVPAVETADKLFSRLPSGDVRGSGGGGCSVAVSSVTCLSSEDKGVSPRQPMDFFRPGTGARDPLTGEVRRLWSKQRPLRVSPPLPAMATLVLPGTVVNTKAICAVEHKHRRAGDSNQLLWGALASPRATRGCRIAETLTLSAMSPEGSEMGTFGNANNDGISSGGVIDGGNSEKLREKTLVGEALAPKNHGRGHFEAEAAVPYFLAMMLREELDISCRLGSHPAGGRDDMMEDNDGCDGQEEAADGSIAGLLGTDELHRRNPACPVVTWIKPSPGLDTHTYGNQTRRNQELHRQHYHQHQRRTWRRRRRQPATTPAVHRGATQNNELVGDVLLAATPPDQEWRQPQQLRRRSKTPRRSHRRHPRPGSSGAGVGGLGGGGARGGKGSRRRQPLSGGAGDLDCYRKPKSGKPAATRGGANPNANANRGDRNDKSKAQDSEREGEGDDGGGDG